MKKRMFFGFTLFVIMFTMVAWQFAAAELAEIQSETKPVAEQELVDTDHRK